MAEFVSGFVQSTEILVKVIVKLNGNKCCWGKLVSKRRSNLLLSKVCFGDSSSPSRQSICLSPSASLGTHTPVLQRTAPFLHADEHISIEIHRQEYQICLCVHVWFTFAAHLVTAVATIIDSIASLLSRHTLAIYTFEATRCVCKYRQK